MYGALEGIIVLAVWLEISASIVLFGAENVAILVSARNAANAAHAGPAADNPIPVKDLQPNK